MRVQAMRNATAAMSRMANTADLSTMARIIKEFDRQNGSLDERIDMIDEAIDSMCEFEGQEVEASDAIGQVLTDIGLDASFLLQGKPSAVKHQQKSEVRQREFTKTPPTNPMLFPRNLTRSVSAARDRFGAAPA